METGIIVEKREMFFLLSCRGCRCCPSVFEPDGKGRPEAVLEGLFRKGWITNTGERFRVKNPLAEAVKQIAEAEKLLCLCHGNRERELLYLYPGNRILAVQESFLRKNSLRLLCVDKTKLQQYLEEQGLLDIEQGWEPLPYVDETVPILPEKIRKRSELACCPWIRLLVECLDGQSGERLGAVGIVRNGFREEIVREDRLEECMVMEPYTTERFMEQLLKMLDEAGCDRQPGREGAEDDSGGCICSGSGADV